MALSHPRKKARAGNQTPAWIVTFADLATLLLTFFILLLSFAEMDVEKYRAMANSMAVAFGSGNVLAPGVGGSPVTLIESDYCGHLFDAVQRGRHFATKFHPEKSQRFGLALISNFLKWKP